MRLFVLFAVLMLVIELQPVVTAGLKHCTSHWLLAQTALPAKMSPTGSLRYNKILL